MVLRKALLKCNLNDIGQRPFPFRARCTFCVFVSSFFLSSFFISLSLSLSSLSSRSRVSHPMLTHSATPLTHSVTIGPHFQYLSGRLYLNCVSMSDTLFGNVALMHIKGHILSLVKVKSMLDMKITIKIYLEN
jgi:hypothetical protein